MAPRETFRSEDLGSRAERFAGDDHSLSEGGSGAGAGSSSIRVRELGISLIVLIALTGLQNLAILTAGVWQYRAQESGDRASVYANLRSIAELPSSEIHACRSEQLGDAALLYRHTPSEQALHRGRAYANDQGTAGCMLDASRVRWMVSSMKEDSYV